MTLPKDSNCCPLCCRVYTAMANHLKKSHYVANKEERKLLLNLACKRVNYRKEACPVIGCSYKSTPLDRHLLEGHTELSRDKREAEVSSVRRAITVRALAALRATNPAPSLASTLDLQDEPEEEGAQIDPEEEACNSQTCTNKRMRQTAALKKTQQELGALRYKYRRLLRRNRRLCKQLGGVSKSSSRPEL